MVLQNVRSDFPRRYCAFFASFLVVLWCSRVTVEISQKHQQTNNMNRLNVFLAYSNDSTTEQMPAKHI